MFVETSIASSTSFRNLILESEMPANGIGSLNLMSVLSPGPVGLGVVVLLGDTQLEWMTDLGRGLGKAIEGSIAVVDAMAYEGALTW